MIHPRADGASAGRAELGKWPALVLTAGLATRLQPLSSVRAKAALPVAGETLVARILRRLRAAGVRRVVLNLHHRADSITRVVGDGSHLDLSVRYSWEPDVLGSAGGPARAIPLLEADRFFIVNGDTLADVGLAALAAQHVATNALVTMAVVDADPRYNAIVTNDAGIVTGFSRREPGTPPNPAHGTPGPPTLATSGRASFGEVSPERPSAAEAETFHFIGVQAVNAAAFSGVSPEHKSETVHGIYPGLIASGNGAIRIFKTGGEFFDIGSPRDYLDTALTIARREGRPIDCGDGCAIAPDARLDDTILWDGVTIGSGARLSHCVVADGVDVPAGAEYAASSIVMRGREMIVTPL